LKTVPRQCADNSTGKMFDLGGAPDEMLYISLPCAHVEHPLSLIELSVFIVSHFLG
jgi:hypothetical protein